jgi:anti-sigma factor RsiW
VSGAQRLTCRQFVDLVTDYLEGSMPAEDRARFEAHLRGCDGCNAYLEQMRTTIAMTGRLCEDDVTAPMRETFLGAFRNWKPASS